jgi:hypothetical protein
VAPLLNTLMPTVTSTAAAISPTNIMRVVGFISARRLGKPLTTLPTWSMDYTPIRMISL